ncbi:hypothetical protein PG997_008001 [Apiospora hydei]|uniref:Uncharacterized protein n=1 Tax=Apiospora hydei TaxID=1337664 RepID=A0ABR1W9P1_9PEZI
MVSTTTLVAWLLGMATSLLASPISGPQGNMTLTVLSLEDGPDGPGLVNTSAVNDSCKGCGVQPPGYTSGCDAWYHQIDDAKFEAALTRFGQLNDEAPNHILKGKSITAVKYEDLVVWACNCGWAQDFPMDQLALVRSVLRRECPPETEGAVCSSGWVYFKDWRKGLNVDTLDSFEQRRSEDISYLCGRSCLAW